MDVITHPTANERDTTIHPLTLANDLAGCACNVAGYDPTIRQLAPFSKSEGGTSN